MSKLRNKLQEDLAELLANCEEKGIMAHEISYKQIHARTLGSHKSCFDETLVVEFSKRTFAYMDEYQNETL